MPCSYEVDSATHKNLKRRGRRPEQHLGTISVLVLGWSLLMAVSFAIPSASEILGTSIPLLMGQVFLNVLVNVACLRFGV